MQWLSLYLPDLPLAAFARPPGGPPLALTAGRPPRIHHADAAAEAAGVRPGQPPATALALCPALRLRSRRPGREAATLESLAAWAGQYSDHVEILPGAGLRLEVGGSARLFGGLEALYRHARDDLDALGHEARTGLAPTPLASWWRALHGSPEPVADELEPALAPLPVAGLGLGPEVETACRRLGLQRLRDLFALPRADLGRRLGPELPTLLERALGEQADPRPRWQPPSTFASRLPLPAPVADTEALLFAARRLLGELAGWLRGRDAATAELILYLHHEAGEPTPLTLGTLQPVRDPDHLLGLLRERLAGFEPPAAVAELALEAGRTAPAPPEQGDLFAAPAERPAWEPLVERLRARLGRAAVTGLAPVSDPRPERAWRATEPGTATGEAPPGGPRPLWLLEVPRPLERPPEVAGEPERIEAGWWDGADCARDYYPAREADGRRIWVYRDRRDGAWYLAGLFG
jgi:protein ImuB